MRIFGKNNLTMIFVLSVSVYILIYGMILTCNNMNKLYSTTMPESSSSDTNVSNQIPAFLEYHQLRSYDWEVTIMGTSLNLNLRAVYNIAELIKNKLLPIFDIHKLNDLIYNIRIAIFDEI